MFDTQTVSERAHQSDYAKTNTRVGRAVYSPVQHFRSGAVEPTGSVSLAAAPPSQVPPIVQANSMRGRVFSNARRLPNAIYNPSGKQQAAKINEGRSVRDTVYDLRLKKCVEQETAPPKSKSLYEWLTNA